MCWSLTEYESNGNLSSMSLTKLHLSCLGP
jgi:hypothetical protein